MGGYWQLGRGGGGCAQPTTTTCIPQGGVWGWVYRGMYAIIAISCLCQEESLKGLGGVAYKDRARPPPQGQKDDKFAHQSRFCMWLHCPKFLEQCQVQFWGKARAPKHVASKLAQTVHITKPSTCTACAPRTHCA